MRSKVLLITLLCACLSSTAIAQNCCRQTRSRSGLIRRIFTQPGYSQPCPVQYYYPTVFNSAVPATPLTPAMEVTPAADSVPMIPLTPAIPVESAPPAEPTPPALPSAEGSAKTDAAATAEKEAGWRSLFDGKQLGEWKVTEFGGEGPVDVEDGQIKCDFGQYMTGVTHSGKDIPTNNYEVELEAMRVDGSDFFCGLTFPVDKSHASFIIGGWGGSVIGISSIDDMDASENSTTGYKVFKNKEWYKVRVRVTPNRLQAWINDDIFVDEEVNGERLSTRIEVDRSKPLGVCCFDTQAAYRNLRIREVKEPAPE